MDRRNAGDKGQTMTNKRRRNPDDDIDIAQSRSFERGEVDTPRIRELEAKASKTRDARLAARRDLEALGDLELVVHVRAEGEGWVAYLPHLGIRGDGRTQAQAKKKLQAAFQEKIAVDPIGALAGIRATLGELQRLAFRVRPSA